MPFRGVIFDLDGTLLDTLADIAGAANEALARRGFPIHPPAAYRLMIGDGVKVLFQRALPPDAQDPDQIADCAGSFASHYARHWNRLTRTYAGIPELLDRLVAQNAVLAVLSNKPHEFTAQCVDGFLKKWPFQVVLGQRDDVPRKPDPAGAQQIADRLNLPSDQVLYLGDTAVDMRAARGADLYPVGALWGYRSRQELEEGGAAQCISHPSELLPIVDRGS